MELISTNRKNEENSNDYDDLIESVFMNQTQFPSTLINIEQFNDDGHYFNKFPKFNISENVVIDKKYNHFFKKFFDEKTKRNEKNDRKKKKVYKLSKSQKLNKKQKTEENVKKMQVYIGLDNFKDVDENSINEEVAINVTTTYDTRLVEFDCTDHSNEVYHIIVGEEINESNICRASFRHVSSIKLPNSNTITHTAILSCDI